MTQQSNQQTLQQRRAAHAFARVASVENARFGKEYGSLVRGLPAMIQTDGIGAALAFIQAKGKDHHIAAYGHLEDWLRQKEQFDFKGDLMPWLLAQSTTVYRQVSSEASAYLVWIKRFAEAKGLESNQNG